MKQDFQTLNLLRCF